MADPKQTETTVRHYLDAVNATNIDLIDTLVHEDVAYDSPGQDRAVGGDALRRALMERARHYDERLSDVAVMLNEHGNRAAAEYTLRGVYRETVPNGPEARNQSYSLPAGAFFELEDGVITRVSHRFDPVQWLRQIEG